MYRLFQLCQKIEEQYCLLLSFLVIRFGSSNPASESGENGLQDSLYLSNTVQAHHSTSSQLKIHTLRERGLSIQAFLNLDLVYISSS